MIRRNSSHIRALLFCAIGLFLACVDDDTPSATASLPELITHAERRFHDGDLNSATASYRRALHKDSTSTVAMVGLARVYEVRGRIDLADRYRRRAFHLHYRIGTAARAAGDGVAARIAFDAAASAMPNHPMAPLKIGEMLLEAAQAESALVYLEKAALADPRFVDARMKLGTALLQVGRTEEAQASFEAAIELNINAVDAYLNLGEIYAGRGEWAQAAAHYDRALLIRPSSELARQGLQAAMEHL